MDFLAHAVEQEERKKATFHEPLSSERLFVGLHQRGIHANSTSIALENILGFVVREKETDIVCMGSSNYSLSSWFCCSERKKAFHNHSQGHLRMRSTKNSVTQVIGKVLSGKLKHDHRLSRRWKTVVIGAPPSILRRIRYPRPPKQ